jgi:hypothetical protein
MRTSKPLILSVLFGVCIFAPLAEACPVCDSPQTPEKVTSTFLDVYIRGGIGGQFANDLNWMLEVANA